VGEPDTAVVRPSPARLRRLFLLALPALALIVLPELGDGGQLELVLVTLGLVLVPFLVGVVLHFRNKHLTRRGDDLVHVDWRGREQLVPRSDIAVAGFVTVARSGGSAPDERLVIERHSGAPPLVVGVTAWDQDEIRRLLTGLGVEVEPGTHAVTRKQLRADLSGYHPPLLERHPILIALVAAVVMLVVVVVVVAVTD
jgi:hypothetical protein